MLGRSLTGTSLGIARNDTANLKSITPLATNESVYIVGEDFDSESDGHFIEDYNEKDNQEKKPPSIRSGGQGSFERGRSYPSKNGNLRIALIIITFLFIASLGTNIYTGV